MNNIFNLKDRNETIAFYIAFWLKQAVLVGLLSVMAYFSTPSESQLRVQELLEINSDFVLSFMLYASIYFFISSMIIMVKTLFCKRIRREKVSEKYVSFLVHSLTAFLMAMGIGLIISGKLGLLIMAVTITLYSRINSFDDMLLSN